ncbi:MAG: hypothetical protein Q9222_006971 [Ikaeria aurantiellina]
MADIGILILGSGMVALPCVEYLLRNKKNHITIGKSFAHSTAQALVAGLPRATTIALDVSSVAALDSHLGSYDLVISLVPYTYHVTIIKVAIRRKVNVVTTSYVSDAMRELDAPAREAGIVVLNEVGMDPGVGNQNLAPSFAHGYPNILRDGRLVLMLLLASLPVTAEHAKNPLGFKFSWSPRGALLSQYNSAQFISEKKIVEISNNDLMGVARPYFVLDGYEVVAYPNRNSVPFQQYYGIPEADTVVRGSLRYEGNPAFVKALIDIGWLDTNTKNWLKAGLTWAEVLQKAIGANSSNESDLVWRVKDICQFPNQAESERILGGLGWIGLFSSEQATVRGNNLLDTLCTQLERKLSYQPGERDLVVLQHKFVVEWRDGNQQTLTSTLELFGGPNGSSAMSKSVGVTCGIATQLLLDGHEALNTPGIVVPYTKAICDPIRELVEKEGIHVVQRVA